MRRLVSSGRAHLFSAIRSWRSTTVPYSSHHLLDTTTTARRCSLDDLPHEVLLLILNFLDAHCLLVCKGVSRLFRSLLSNDILLTYRIELAINGMIDGPPTAGLGIQERLDKLRQYSVQSCTGHFPPDTETKLGRIGLGDLTHLMTPRDSLNPLPDSFGGSFTFELVTEGDRSLVVYVPPSIIESTSARRWTISLPLSGGKRILAVDVTQDLAVAVASVPGNHGKGQMFLLSLESHRSEPASAAHPLAEHPILEIDWTQARLSVKIVALQVFGTYVAWKMPYGGDAFGDHLEVRNWKTGHTLWDIRMDHIPSYTFIDASYLAMIFNPTDDYLPNVRGRCADIRIYRIREEAGLPVDHVATLQLPPDVEGFTMMTSSVPSPPTPPPSAAFWPDPEQRTVVLRLTALDPSPPKSFVRMLQPHRSRTPPPSCLGGRHDALLVIPCTTFSKHVTLVATAPSLTPNLPIPWEDWGLRGTVLIPGECFADPFLSDSQSQPAPKFVFPFGPRLTIFSRSSTLHGGPRFITLDVNPLSKLHPSHSNCTRRDALASTEKVNESDLPSNLKTSHPRSYFFGPTFSDVQRMMAITQIASGYAVLMSLPFDLLYAASC